MPVLPSYVTLDPHSQWHVSGLLSTALESITLPSRLKPQNMSLQTLDEFANTLNINGRQNIAKLRMGLDRNSYPNGHEQSGRFDIQAQKKDTRLPSLETPLDESRIADEDGL